MNKTAWIVTWVALTISSVLGAPEDPLKVPVKNKPPLSPNAFNFLPLTSVEPTGWLRTELETQANGLSGHVDEFWPDLSSNSAWLGGTGEGWERGPYYLDGLVPLAYLLNDSRLIAKVKKWMDWALEHQQPSGMLGPVKNVDWWPNFVMLKAMTQYYEASGDQRVIPAMKRYFKYQLKQIDKQPLKEWARFRWQDEVLSLIWLYNRDPDPELLQLARKLHEQGHSWKTQYAQFGYTDKMSAQNLSLASHGVNNGQALKTAAVWSVISGQKDDRDGAYQMVRELYQYHGQPNGMFSCDEHLAGRNPSQGTELCTVVETMYSFEVELSILGDAMFGDRLETIAFNALPGTFTTDMWAHQYDQQANQVMVSLSKRDWVNNGPDSNTFGLEPNFGCCTANMHQGWPKFTANLWMSSGDDGLAATAYAPSVVKSVVNRSVPVEIVEETEYPFGESVDLTIKPSSTIEFPLYLRIPEWAENATVTVNRDKLDGVKTGSFFTIKRRWSANDKVELRFPMTLRVNRAYHNAVVIERGPVIYSLAIGEQWRKIKQTGPAADWEVFPTTPWNYALVLDPLKPTGALRVVTRPMGKRPFSADGTPVYVAAEGRRLPQWQIENDSAGPLPVSPVETKEPKEPIKLIPYAAAKLRITAFPYTEQ
jgi:hypothetical protein